MASKTVNEDLMIVTMGSKHLADTKATTDKCFLKDKKTVVPYRNYIPTADCDNSQATQKTLIRNYRIIHNETKIGNDYGGKPSKDDAFAGFGGGVANGQVYYKHANDYPGQHSKNVKVEGKWIVRTNDETQQNKRNTTGKFYEGDGGITEDELEQLLNKGCTVEAVKTKCTHRDTTVDRIGVLEGDAVTLEYNKHVNDAEVDPGPRAKPQCQVPRRKAAGKLPATEQTHPCFRVTRSAYPETKWRKALPALTKVIPGLKIDLAEEWLGQKPPEPEKSQLTVNPDPKDKASDGSFKGAEEKVATALTRNVGGGKGIVTPGVRDSDNTPGNALGSTAGNPNVEGARMRRDQAANPTSNPAAQARGEAEARAAQARDEQNRALRESMGQSTVAARAAQAARDKKMDEATARSQAAKKSWEVLNNLADIKAIFDAKPVEVKVEALACAGAKVVTVAAYPPKPYQANLIDLKEVIATFKAIYDTISRVVAFLKKLQNTDEKQEGKGADAPLAQVNITAGRYQVKVWILADCNADFGMEWRELTRDAGAGEQIGRKKHEVFRAFTLDIQFERMIGVVFSASVPVSYATGALGAFAQSLLDRLGADLSFKFEVELSVGISAGIEYSEYGKFDWGRQSKLSGNCKFTISLNGKMPGASFSIGVTIQWKPSLSLIRSPDQPMVLKRNASSVDIGWFVKAAVNIFGWVVELKYEGEIWKGPIPEATYALG